ncbi:hypothetical protein [Pseudohaliea rubra]|uniref:Uncharacterized protein n=1 Tax=Pseudohaliea rubra DSM 19751 TaxID=1265313 RepID=A0A095WWN2_9GAMM|nr:hypothetical protein [Pseudohaliea rubra]KGE03049.1 hypothetical protein HRUBRA_02366 [Pseudohaliea rubra DSM 19751]
MNKHDAAARAGLHRVDGEGLTNFPVALACPCGACYRLPMMARTAFSSAVGDSSGARGAAVFRSARCRRSAGP